MPISVLQHIIILMPDLYSELWQFIVIVWFDLFSISYFYWLEVLSLSPEVSGTLGGAEEASEPIKARSAKKGKKQEHPANSGTADCMEIQRWCLWQTPRQEQRWHVVSLRDERASLGMADAMSVNLHMRSRALERLVVPAWCQPPSRQRGGCHHSLNLVFMVPAHWNAFESGWICF